MVLTERLPPLGPGAKKEDRDAQITEEFLLPANEENRVRAKTETAAAAVSLLHVYRSTIASIFVGLVFGVSLELMAIAVAGGMTVFVRLHA